MSKKTKNVVVLDDDEVDVFFARREIDKTGLFNDVHQFTSPRDALKFFQDYQSDRQDQSEATGSGGKRGVIDLLLLDFRMPYLNGIEFLQSLRADGLDHLVSKVAVMLTIPLLPDDEDRFREVDEHVFFLDKPLEADCIASVIRA